MKLSISHTVDITLKVKQLTGIKLSDQLSPTTIYSHFFLLLLLLPSYYLPTQPISGNKYSMVDHDESSDFSDTESIDSCEEFLNFKSIRTDGHLEEAISFQWPDTRKIVISTLLEEDDLAPLFDGSRWAGTRLWAAAVRAVQYITGNLPGTEDRLLAQSAENCDDDGGKKPISILELGW